MMSWHQGVSCKCQRQQSVQVWSRYPKQLWPGTKSACGQAPSTYLCMPFSARKNDMQLPMLASPPPMLDKPKKLSLVSEQPAPDQQNSDVDCTVRSTQPAFIQVQPQTTPASAEVRTIAELITFAALLSSVGFHAASNLPRTFALGAAPGGCYGVRIRAADLHESFSRLAS